MPVALLTLLPYLKRVWSYVAIILAVILAYTWAHHRGVEAQRAKDAPVIAALNATIANVRTVTAKAQADDKAHSDAVVASDQRIGTEYETLLQSQLADARARAADLGRRLSNAASTTNPGGRAVSPMPAASDAASGSIGAGQASVMASDNTACAEAVIKAQGWKDWWGVVSAASR